MGEKVMVEWEERKGLQNKKWSEKERKRRDGRESDGGMGRKEGTF